MSASLSQLQDLLLDMLGTDRKADASLVESLGKDEWELIISMLNQHRLAPLFHWRLEHDHAGLPVPDDIREAIAEQNKQSVMRSLMLQRELILVHRLLARADVPHLALKGAYLAFFSYPHPAMRPLRDLDLLVPKDRALEAYEALIQGGFIRPEQYPGNPEAAMEAQKHLPPLLTPGRGLWIELHTKLAHAEHEEIDAPELVIHQRWDRAPRRTIANEELSFLSPTDSLLHLIVHAVHDHKFSNGPLTLSDLFYLVQNDEIDWELFWECARQQHVIQGCVLVLKMTERYYGTMAIDWGEVREMPHDSVIEKASRLMLRDLEDQGFSNLKSARMGKTGIGKISVYASRLFPSRQEIASRYPVSMDSIKILFWYPVWWAYVTGRVWRNMTRKDKSGMREEAESLVQLEAWLKE